METGEPAWRSGAVEDGFVDAVGRDLVGDRGGGIDMAWRRCERSEKGNMYKVRTKRKDERAQQMFLDDHERGMRDEIWRKDRLGTRARRGRNPLHRRSPT